MHVLSGRGTANQIGAIMVADVFARILPNWKIVAAWLSVGALP